MPEQETQALEVGQEVPQESDELVMLKQIFETLDRIEQKIDELTGKGGQTPKE